MTPENIDRILYLLIGRINNALDHKETEELNLWIGESPGNRRIAEESSNPRFIATLLQNWKPESALQSLNHVKQQIRAKYHEGLLSDEVRQDFDLRHDSYIETEHYGATHPVKVKHRIFNHIAGGLDKFAESVKHTTLWSRISLAAAAVVAVVFGIWLYEIASPQKAFRNDEVIVNDIKPGRNVATLAVAGGMVIQLSDEKSGVVIGASKISYNDGSLIDNASSGDLPQTASMASVVTPRGGTYQITLSDGTKVWLNADSKLEFPSNFENRGQRIVKVVGEAYFEVAKDKKHPFIVETEKQKIEVLGTHFNVNAYKDEENITTTLLEGSVKLSLSRSPTVGGNNDVLLQPGQQAQNDNKSIRIKKVDVSAVIAWTRGDFVFPDEELTSIMRKLSRWYGIEVEYRNAPEYLRFDAIISRSNNLSAILNIIQNTDKVKFRIEGRKVIVTK